MAKLTSCLVRGVAGAIVALTLAGASSLANAKEKPSNAAADNPTLSLQVALDRQRFSPGPIDGKMGSNTRKALKAFQRAHAVPETGEFGAEVRKALGDALDRQPLRDYEIKSADVEGPFAEKIPDGLEQQAKFDKLSYTSVAEGLAEKFHMDIDFLKRLNPGKKLDEAGTVIKVAAIERDGAFTLARLEVNKSIGSVLAFDREDKLIAAFPATIGSQDTPSPSGKVKIKGVARNPVYTYDPEKLDFKGVDAKEKLKIAPGPNNPVGLVWIDLDKPGYGIHGSPEPALISRQESHGCVRLTNWDALDLAQAVRKGMRVEFTEVDTASK